MRRPRCWSSPRRRSKRYGLKPRARIHHLSVRADDPIWHLTAPIPATAHALKKAGMKIEDIDLVEINEAFASVVMAWLKETGYPHERTNVNGGAIALGHPLGASGARLMTTLLHELERTRRPLRPADHVRGRRPGQRDDHRAAVGRHSRGLGMDVGRHAGRHVHARRLLSP